jgi:hypothetical protein
VVLGLVDGQRCIEDTHPAFAAMSPAIAGRGDFDAGHA